jgi:hypothetical protein
MSKARTNKIKGAKYASITQTESFLPLLKGVADKNRWKTKTLFNKVLYFFG